MLPPSFLMVLTASGDYAYRRKDGVLVVPIGCLKGLNSLNFRGESLNSSPPQSAYWAFTVIPGIETTLIDSSCRADR